MMKINKSFFVYIFSLVLFSVTQAMLPEAENNARKVADKKSDWVSPKTKLGGDRWLRSHSDLSLLGALESCLVSHDPSVSVCKYDELSNLIVRLLWSNNVEREWLEGYVELGCIPVFYRVLELELQEVELKSATTKDLSDAMKIVCRHVLEFLILVRADLEFLFLKTGDDKRGLYEQIKNAFVAQFQLPGIRSSFKNYLQRNSKNKALFDECVNSAAEWLCRAELTHTYNNWMLYYIGISGMTMSFRNPEPTELVANPKCSPEDTNLYTDIVIEITDCLKREHQSMYHFLLGTSGNSSSQTSREPTPPPRQEESA